MKATINRTYSPHQTRGEFTLQRADARTVLSLKTLELPFRNNKRRVSCIPEGTYQVVPRRSKKYGLHYHVTNVPGRDFILIHTGNFTSQILGCILPGLEFADINADGQLDVLSSRSALKRLLTLAPNGFELTITS